ncbi:MAG: adenylate/guanylate cyclase domain-containing protein [Nitrospinae bacterium CG11_big_fil_rev_8_21_14_0_20_56_8]|nr:MAG: adenylate/guanylate cyclase domain-containing protein [Nitrospinae bacterium CG11_big_fil_rev_8_21_14_0_20_56_8]
MKRFLAVTPFKIGIFLTFIMVFVVVWNPAIFEILESQLIDFRFINRGPKPPGPEVAIVVIDEKSLDELGQWPWPRSVLAALVDKLAELNVVTVGFDVVFAESGDRSQIDAISLVNHVAETLPISDELREQIATSVTDLPTPDELFAESIQKADNVFLGFFFHDSLQVVQHLSAAQIQKNLERIFPTGYQDPTVEPEAFTQVLMDFPAVESSLQGFVESSAGGGYLNLAPDRDGILRRFPLVVRSRDRFFAPLFLQMVAHYLEMGPLHFTLGPYGVSKVQVGENQIPTDLGGRLLINYYGPQRSFPHYSVTDILHDRIDPGLLDSRIVLVGATGKGLTDLRPTPFEKIYPGVEIHATLIDNILQNRFLRQPKWHFTFLYAFILGIGIILSFILSRAKGLVGFMITLLCLTLYFYFNQEMFRRGYLLNLVYPSLQIFLVYIAISLFNYLTESKQSQLITGMFGRYLSPMVVNKLIKNPDLLRLGGAEARLTAFFSDVAGFSTISESLTPTELVALLNEYLTAMSEIVLRYDGIIDKYEGDAIIAFFGAPVEYPDHALRACLVSLDMQKKLEEMRQEWNARGKPGLRCRVGLNTGLMVVGNMGSKMRMDYTIMGDAVNLASRLEGVNKVYGSHIMISQFTYEDAKEGIEVRELDKIRVVGKAEPVTIYEVLARKGELDPILKQTVEVFEEGLRFYRAKQWYEAINLFHRALELRPGDTPSEVFIRRCQEFMIAKVPDPWDGVYQMTSK